MFRFDWIPGTRAARRRNASLAMNLEEFNTLRSAFLTLRKQVGVQDAELQQAAKDEANDAQQLRSVAGSLTDLVHTLEYDLRDMGALLRAMEQKIKKDANPADVVKVQRARQSLLLFRQEMVLLGKNY